MHELILRSFSTVYYPFFFFFGSGRGNGHHLSALWEIHNIYILLRASIPLICVKSRCIPDQICNSAVHLVFLQASVWLSICLLYTGQIRVSVFVQHITWGWWTSRWPPGVFQCRFTTLSAAYLPLLLNLWLPVENVVMLARIQRCPYFPCITSADDHI